MKILEERYERAEPEGIGKTFAEMIRTEIQIDGRMEGDQDPPSDEVTPADTLLKASNGPSVEMRSWDW